MAPELSVPRARTVYRCRYCGAPLRVGPDTVVAICPYCGRPNWIRGEGGELLAAPAPGSVEAEKFFQSLVERDPDLRSARPVLARLELVYIPFYEGEGSAYSEYHARGVLHVTVTRRRGDRAVTETRTVSFSVGGIYRASFKALVLARRSSSAVVVGKLAKHYLSTRPRLEPLEKAVDKWEHGFHDALAASIGVDEARDALIDDVCDAVRERVRARIREQARLSYQGPGTVTGVEVVDETIPCSLGELATRGPIFLPLVTAYYAVESRIYRAFFAGWDGSPLLREEPYTATQRLVVSSMAGLVSGALGAGGAYIAAMGGLEAVAAGLALAALGAYAGYRLSRAALSPVRLEEGGPRGWASSITTTVELG